MNTIPRGGRYPDAIRKLKEKGYLLRGEYPTQHPVEGLLKDGVDITIRFQRMSPEAFLKQRDLVLEAAYEEAKRYENIPDFKCFASIDVDIGSKSRKPKEFTFTASGHTDPEIMVYGLGGPMLKGWSLADIVDQIIDTPRRYRDKYKDPTYKIKKLIVSIRDKGYARRVKDYKKKDKEEGL